MFNIYFRLLFSRIQNLHISQTSFVIYGCCNEFSRIQNLHISQTIYTFYYRLESLVEFKIYISLKLCLYNIIFIYSLVEFKIYISLKPQIEIWSRNFEFGYKKMDRHRSRPEGNLDKIFI